MMKKNLGLIAALVAALVVVVFTGCPYPTNGDVTLEGRIVEPDAWKNAKGLTDEIGVQSSATLDKATGTIGLTGSGSALFTLKLPAKTTAGAKTIKIKYICILKGGSDAEVTLKDGDWGDIKEANSATCNWYPKLKTDEVATLELKEAWYEVGTETISFQRSDSAPRAFKLKILEVKIE